MYRYIYDRTSVLCYHIFGFATLQFRRDLKPKEIIYTEVRGAVDFASVEVAESVGLGFEHRERLHVGHRLRSVRPTWRERNGRVVAGSLRGLFDSGASAQHNQVRQRDFLAAGL